jgi:HPt (histidine-containing phosphotransfer) domain-containing protein
MGESPSSEDRVASAIANGFGGDAELYHTFVADCRAQFDRDLRAGESAFAARDVSAIGQLAHNLRSALTLLGHAPLGELAGEVERHAKAGDWHSLVDPWECLVDALQALLTN